MAQSFDDDLHIVEQSNIDPQLLAALAFPNDLNVIQGLDDEPNDVGGLTATQLKEKFDEAGLTIQRYINETLVPAVIAADATETARDNAEEARKAAEKARELAETQRQEQASTTQAEEEARKAQEEGRVQAEQLRVEAENGRAEAENSRDTAEQERMDAETERANEEDKRRMAEADRAKAEEERAKAEEAREDKEKGFVAQAKAEADRAEEATGKTPYVGENGNWFVWNSTTRAFVDSGVPAQGDPGEKGEKGDPGQDGVLTSLGSGVFAMGISEDGHLLVAVNEQDAAPPLEINAEGHLIYKINS